MDQMRLVFASNNAHKLAEVREIMPSGVEVLSLEDIGFEQEIAETGVTLEENSKIKAQAVWEWINGGNGENGENGDATLNGENGENGVRKVMIDGLLYIVKDGKMFDAQGRQVK
jgi:hypothetical protein